MHGEAIRITTLIREEAEHTWHGAAWGAERVIVSQAGLIFAGDAVQLRLHGEPATTLAVFPALDAALAAEGGELRMQAQNGYSQITVQAPAQAPGVQVEACGDGKFQVLFVGDAWQGLSDLFLHVDYEGDIAMAYIDGRLVADNFCNGTPWRIGLKRFMPDVLAHGLCLVFRPLQQGVVKNISSSVAALFRFEGKEHLVVHAIDAIPEYSITIRR